MVMKLTTALFKAYKFADDQQKVSEFATVTQHGDRRMKQD